MKRKHNPVFDAFVRLYPDKQTEWSKRTGKREWCFNGNKFTEDPLKQLVNLVKMLRRDGNLYQVIELRDVRKIDKNNPLQQDHLVLKMVNKVVKINNVQEYIKNMTDGK